MIRNVRIGILQGIMILAIFLATNFCTLSAQDKPVTFRTSSNLVLVDVVAFKNGLPEKTLRLEDFQLFDNGSPVSIKTFDAGAQATTRPLSIWLVVQCRMPNWEGEGSGFFSGQIDRLLPALKHLDKSDSVGVAHWCDDGAAQVDLQPTANVNEAVAAVEQVLAAVPSVNNHDRAGELALQRTLQLMVEATRAAKPEPLPVVIFLYGDHSGMPKSEANHFIDELLETSAVAFGLRDRRSPHMWWLLGEQKEVAHYIASETGGEYLDVTPQTYGLGLDQILQQLHFRYELGFQAPVLDGKRHKLTVKFVGNTKKGHNTVRLRYRTAYVPIQRDNLQAQVSH